MSSPVPFLIQGKNIILVIDGKSHTISKDTHLTYPQIVECLREQDWDRLREIVEPARALVDFGEGHVEIKGDQVLWKGRVFHNALSTRMIEMFQDGFPIDPLVRFMENLMENPSMRSVEQLYKFLEKNKLPITEDGHFLAYKKVNKNFTDIHSGTIDNSVGQTVTMDRNMVSDDPGSYCSSGLHFCAIGYLSGFGQRDDPVVIVKINPRDVVSIPNDCNGEKGRCCRYDVVGLVEGDPVDSFKSVVDTEYGSASEFAPKSSWPFDAPTPPVAEDDSDDLFEEDEFDLDDVLGEDLFDLRRVSNDDLEYQGLTLEEAQARIEANRRQKKANLYIVYADTLTKYEDGQD